MLCCLLIFATFPSRYAAMKKVILVCTCMLFTATLPAKRVQEINSQSVMQISDDEAVSLNKYLKVQRKHFDFTGKKVAFMTGSSGTSISSKRVFLQSVGDAVNHPDQGAPCSIQILKPQQKIASGGYDAIVFFRVKVNRKASGRMLRKLKDHIPE